MGANVAAIVIVVIAVYLMIVGLRGTQNDVWSGLFSNAKLPDAQPTSANSNPSGGSGSGGGGGGTAGTYSYAQLQSLAQGAGFTQAESAIAAAIALAESAGNPSATGPVGERGLWQVYPGAHPDLASQYNLYDPVQNAQAAYMVFQEQGWGAWTTYLNGAYRQYLPTGTTTV